MRIRGRIPPKWKFAPASRWVGAKAGNEEKQLHPVRFTSRISFLPSPSSSFNLLLPSSLSCRLLCVIVNHHVARTSAVGMVFSSSTIWSFSVKLQWLLIRASWGFLLEGVELQRDSERR